MYHIAILEPNQELKKPYCYIEKFYQEVQFFRTTNPDRLCSYLDEIQVHLICLSSSCSKATLLTILEKINAHAKISFFIPAVAFIIDLNCRDPQILGTHWNDELGILHSLSNQSEVFATLQRITTLDQE